MGLFKADPLWLHSVPVDRRISVGTVIVGYDFCRAKIGEALVAPLETVMGNRKVKGRLRERLVDEGLLGALRSSTIPRNGRGVIPDHLARSLPDVLGVLACASANHHAGQVRAHMLEETSYSDDPGIARRQVLAVWSELAGLSPTDVDAVDKAGFAEGWEMVTTSLLNGMLTGLSRAGRAMLLAEAEKVARMQPRYLDIVVQDLLGSAA